MKKNSEENDFIYNNEIMFEEKNPNYTPKPKRKKVLIIITIIIVILLILILNLYLIISGKINFYFSNKNNKSETKIELKYTETNDTKNEGIYVTDVSQVVEQAMPSIVAITSKTLLNSNNYGFNYYNQNAYIEGAGSGIIIAQNDEEIFILTNNHVVENSNELIVQFIGGESSDARVVGISERKDVAIIAVKINDLDKSVLDSIKIATIGSSEDLKVGNGIIAIGNALGYGQSVTTGVVSALDREVTTDSYTIEMIQIDAAINGGNSGGALLNSKGEVVGINTAKYSSNGLSSGASIEGMGFAIPISEIKDLIEDLMNGKNDSNGVTLGIEGYMTNIGNLSVYNLPVGFYISNITDGGVASKYDLEIGNIITEIDGKSISKVEDIRKVLTSKDEGDKVILTIKYVKGREYLEKKVTIIF